MAELTEAQVIVGTMPKMYEITDELRDVYALLASPDADIDPSTGEVGEDITHLLNSLEGQFQDKARKIADLIDQLEYDASLYMGPLAAVSEKLANLQKAQKRILGRIDWLTGYLKTNMEAAGYKELIAGDHRLVIKTAGGNQALEWLGQPVDIPDEWAKDPPPEPAREFDRKKYAAWAKGELPVADWSPTTGLPKDEREKYLAETAALFIKEHPRKTRLELE